MHFAPWLNNSMWPQHTLQMFADHFGPRQTILFETINQGLLQPKKGCCTLVSSYLIIATGISSFSFVQVFTTQVVVSSLSKGISSTLNFHESIGADGTQVVSIELTWLLQKEIEAQQILPVRHACEPSSYGCRQLQTTGKFFFFQKKKKKSKFKILSPYLNSAWNIHSNKYKQA